MKQKQAFSTRMIAVMALLIAVSIILSRLLGFYITPSLRISFEYFPIILDGILFGPICGVLLASVMENDVLTGYFEAWLPIE